MCTIECSLGYEEREDFLVDHADKCRHFEGMSYPKIRIEIRAKVEELAQQRADDGDNEVMGELIMHIQNKNNDHPFLRWLRRPK
jgi:hypothetical protein